MLKSYSKLYNVLCVGKTFHAKFIESVISTEPADLSFGSVRSVHNNSGGTQKHNYVTDNHTPQSTAITPLLSRNLEFLRLFKNGFYDKDTQKFSNTSGITMQHLLN